MEDGLKAIWEVGQGHILVPNGVLAKHLSLTPVAAHEMVKRLVGLALLIHVPYRGSYLTDGGRHLAFRLLRRHRLLEVWLVERLGMGWDEVNEVAEQWEHVVSDGLVECMAALRGHAPISPHGAPIPTREGTLHQNAQVPLTQLAPGQMSLICQVSDHDAAMLRYLAEQGLRPQRTVQVLAKAPGGVLCVQVGDSQALIGPPAAPFVFVAP